MSPARALRLLLAAPLLLACAPASRSHPSHPPAASATADASPNGRGGPAATVVIPVVPFDRPFRLAFDHVVRVGDSGVRLRFAKLAEDSRCPLRVTCVLAGRVRAELQIGPAEGDAQTIELGTDADRTTATVAGLRLELQGVEPGPHAAGEPQAPVGDYTLTLVARRHS